MTALGSALVGTWEIVSYRTSLPDGRVFHPLGQTPVGTITYTGGGQMSVNLMRAGRDPWSGENVGAATPDELEQAARGYLAYAGGYTVEEDPGDGSGVVSHHVTVSLYPNWVGVTQRRFATLDPPLLTLRAPEVPTRVGPVTPELVWRRLADG